jgi:phosphate starvation-inducible PhoH-like protein
VIEQKLEFESERYFHKLYGEKPEHLKLIENAFGISLVARSNILLMSGDQHDVDLCSELFKLLELGREQGMITKKSDFLRFLDKVSRGKGRELHKLLEDPLVLNIRKKSVVPRNLGAATLFRSHSEQRLSFWDRTGRYRENILSDDCCDSLFT